MWRRKVGLAHDPKIPRESREERSGRLSGRYGPSDKKGRDFTLRDLFGVLW
jgi:hypothetical protein